MQLLDICKRNNYIYYLYEEIGSRDSLDEIPEMNRLLDSISNYSKVLIVAIDRLSRNEFYSAMITHTFKENNVQIVTPTKEYNFDEENDILMSDFEKLIARFEFRIIKKRLRQGKINEDRQGNFVHDSPFFFLHI